jgi:hypothetical protein
MPKKGLAREKFFQTLLLVKLIILEIAATVVFLVWVYRELIHELHN